MNKADTKALEAEMKAILSADGGEDRPVPATIEELEAEMARIMER